MENQYYAEPFFVKDNSLFMNKLIKGRETEVKLCNFTARIVEDITCTNGAENERFLSIVGTDEKGNDLRKITVPLKNFAQLDWAQEYWSMNCVVEAGYGNRDNLRQAIQSTAKFAEAKTIYGTTGWWETATGWQFCMPGNSNAEVELTEKTKGYSFKTDSDITETMAVMKNFPYSVAPKEIMFPMLAYTLVSILGTFMAKAGKETKTVIMLYGKTGSMKTTLSLLINSLFGRFNEDNIPMNFRDTPKSILNYCFTLKDCAVIIDDYHPGSGREQSAQDATTQALIRGICNREARGALDKSGRQRAAKRPQCNVIMTAEYLPNVGESGVARFLSLELMLVDSNLHREHILPSEKAFALKLKMDAMSRQGQRTDLTSTQVGRKLETAEIIGEQLNESKNQVRRYIRLTYLIPELLDLVDEGRIAFTPAVELSYLNEIEQADLYEEICVCDATPNLSQAQRLRAISREEGLTPEHIGDMYDTFVRHVIGDGFVTKFKKSDIKRFYNYLADERCLKASTIDSVHTVLHQVFDMAVDDDYIRSNPSDNVLKELKQTHLAKSEKRMALTRAEQDLFLDFLKNSRVYNHWYTIFAVMIGTGLRVGEVTGLRWCDIDLENGVIDVNHTLVYYAHRTENSKQGCYFNVNTPKTSASTRQVPMLDFVKEAFIKEKEVQELLDIKCEATIDGYTDFIFVNRFGNVQHQGTLNKAIRRIIRDCNDEQFLKSDNPKVLLPHFSCHSLRHTFTTRMCEAGVNVKVIQDTLGHTDVSTTLNIYTAVTKELKRVEFEGLDRFFKNDA